MVEVKNKAMYIESIHEYGKMIEDIKYKETFPFIFLCFIIQLDKVNKIDSLKVRG